MSSIGKIFTVLNLILAAAFLGWAANALNANSEWKAKYEGEVTGRATDKAGLQAELSKLSEANKALENARNTLTKDRDDAKNTADRNLKDLENERSANGQLRAAIDKFAATEAGIEQDKTKLQASKDQAEKAQRDAEEAKRVALDNEAKATTKATDLEAALQKANNDIADLEKAKTGLMKEKAGVETQLATLVDATHATLADYAPVPLISAGVLDVSMAVEPGLVAINKGSADGVKRGYTFEVYDGKTYKGQVRVEFVHDHQCSAIIARKVPGQTIRQGDSAQTRL